MPISRQPAFWILLLGILGQWACRKVHLPTHYDPGIEIEESWKAQGALSEAAVDRWWTHFNEPGLSQVIEACLLENRDLKAAAARVEAALIESRIAGAGLKPTVSAGLNGDRRRQNFIGLPIPGADGNVLSRTFTSFGLSLNLSWEPDLWGRLKAGQLSSLALYEAEDATASALQLSLAAQTAKAWFASVEAKSQLDLARETVASYQRSVRWIRNRFEAGVRPAVDLRLALTDLESAGALVYQRQEQLDRALRQVEILISRYPSGAVVVPSRLPSLPGPVPAGVPAAMIGRRPDLRAARARLLASDARTAESRAALLPQFNLTTSGGTSTSSLVDLLDGDFSVWSLAGGLLQPVFQSGRLKQGVKLSEARALEAMQVYAGSVLRALAEVESALAAEKALAARLSQLDNAAGQAQAAVSLASDRYRRGVGEVLNVLDSQRRVLNTESQALTVRRLLLENRVDLYLGLGGDVSADSAPEPPEPAVHSTSTGKE